MFLTVPWGILILGKIARGMFCIIKSNYIISCNNFVINREKLGDYLKWTDYSPNTIAKYSRSMLLYRYSVSIHGLLAKATTRLSCIRAAPRSR